MIDPHITFEWNELDMNNETSLAANFSARMMALATLKDRNAISAEEMRKAARLEKSGRLEWLDDEAPEEDEGDLMTDSGVPDFLSQLSSGSEHADGEEDQNRPSD